jgi:hypothetical protein
MSRNTQMPSYGSKRKKVYEKSNVLVLPRPHAPPPPAPPVVPKRPKEIFAPPPPEVAEPCFMRSLPESANVSYNLVCSRTPSSSSLVSEPVAPRPVLASVVARVRVVPEAKPEIIVPAPEPEPELVPGSRAWKINQFIKANFKN